ncbi:ribose-phosphate diphosphokinase [Kordiimonas gwangyangensis]|uniref:ribose-phosphate diphosphokinase n=1 Tax=Kordiimonas gwangyangensis TaxID=288022 RepID=UPI00038074E2|nr:ribose-phosphate diphosphokinase [Kordiimonas gwangyangensis]
MTGISLHAFPGYESEAAKLATALQVQLHAVDIHAFPDGESRVRIEPVAGTAILFAGLDHPDSKITPLLLAAAALRDWGASRVVLVCPYLCYMRQDKAFAEGEAVSQRVFGAMLARFFDRVITVDPHLHRVSSLADVMPGIQADVLSAASAIGEMIAGDDSLRNVILVGPDSESRQWVSQAASQAEADYLIAQKVRHGDRNVEITLENAASVRGHPVVIVDDLISSGATVCRCAELLSRAGASRIEVAAVHMLADDTALEAIKAAGVTRIRSSSSIKHPSNAFSLTPLFVAALEEEVHHGH